MDCDQRLHDQNDKRNEEKTMNVDENVFFRVATLRICSSLNIVETMRSCFDYLKLYIPTNRMLFHIYDADLNLTRLVASVGGNPDPHHVPFTQLLGINLLDLSEVSFLHTTLGTVQGVEDLVFEEGSLDGRGRDLSVKAKS